LPHEGVKLLGEFQAWEFNNSKHPAKSS
jgi:hypothetical protein